tara:strand:+ start:6047 stop:6955 length:909 start_codon:yes stop_codon:yes gene_type:complete
MGTPLFAVPILKSLYQNGYPVTTVYTQPPQKSKRGMKTQKSPVHLMSETLNIEVRTPDNLKNNSEELDYFKRLNVDLAIVVAYGKLIPEDYLNHSKKGFINIHASLLPKYRGAAPIQRALMNLDEETGISIMKINKDLDSGPLCNSYKIEILKNDNTDTISDKLSAIASEKILDNIDQIFEGKAIFKEQEHAKASYAKKINKSEGKIDWKDSSANILGKIKGLYPFPGAWFVYNGERFKVLSAISGNTQEKPGQVINDSLEVSCGKGSIKILEIQREGKKPQKISEFILGSQIKKGSNLSEL